MPAGRSWGGYPQAQQRVVRIERRDATLPDTQEPMLAYGNGRSYGDSCLNDGGVLLHTRGLDRFIAFDAQRGVLRCEAGVLLSEILDFAVPRGWMLPVLPGTQFVTVGGAIANDVHGKNHHRVGSFGEHVLRFELLRSDGTRRECSRAENADWFQATIAGLGLTGLVTWAELQLQPSVGPWVRAESLPFRGVATFLEMSRESELTHEYVVAWIDCGSGSGSGRGLLQRANPVPHAAPASKKRRWSVPLTPPLSLVNRLSVRLFNNMYYALGARSAPPRRQDYRAFLFPLDAVENWNRIYGPRGFLQFQCVVPEAAARDTLGAIIQRISQSGCASFLAVLKRMGDRPASGMLSFPRAGVTLAVDFPMQGTSTLRLLDALGELVADAGGALYPAKDACMRPAHFQNAFPNWKSMSDFLDPRFSSGFWRRVTETA